MIYIRFEKGAEDKVSQVYGPFEFVQLTYTDLRVGPDGTEFAYLSMEGDWIIINDRAEWWSDVIIYHE